MEERGEKHAYIMNATATAINFVSYMLKMCLDYFHIILMNSFWYIHVFVYIITSFAHFTIIANNSNIQVSCVI